MDYIVTMCLTMMLDSKSNDCTFLPKFFQYRFITKFCRLGKYIFSCIIFICENTIDCAIK